jgi:hypothetical protein
MLLQYDWEVNLYEIGHVVAELAMAVTHDVQLKVLSTDLVWQGPLIKVSYCQSHVLSDLVCSHACLSSYSDLIYVYGIDGLSIIFFESIGN